MTLIALPTGVVPSQFSLRQAIEQRASSSNFGGSEQVVDLLNDRWMVSLVFANRSHADAAILEAFLGGLRGMTNTVALWHFLRPVPRGNMRGAPTAQAAAAGAGALTLNTTAGATLRTGDMLGVGGLLLQVASDAVANGSGVMVVPLINRLRRAVTAGVAVAWDKPTAPFRLISQVGVEYVPGYSPELPLDFSEAVT